VVSGQEEVIVWCLLSSAVAFAGLGAAALTFDALFWNETSTGQLGRGYNNNPYFNGDIAELLVYSRALSDAELRTVQRYLLQKYFPALPLPASLTGEEQAAPPTDTPEATPNDVPTETPTTP
jgi:hypothetical protein